MRNRMREEGSVTKSSVFSTSLLLPHCKARVYLVSATRCQPPRRPVRKHNHHHHHTNTHTITHTQDIPTHTHTHTHQQTNQHTCTHTHTHTHISKVTESKTILHYVLCEVNKMKLLKWTRHTHTHRHQNTHTHTHTHTQKKRIWEWLFKTPCPRKDI